MEMMTRVQVVFSRSKKSVIPLIGLALASVAWGQAAQTESSNPEPLTFPTFAQFPPQPSVSAAGPFALSLDGDLELAGIVVKQGYPFVHTEGGFGAFNTALGLNALASVTPNMPSVGYGTSNTAFGTAALVVNSSGVFNTALGDRVLLANTVSNHNTGVGALALYKSYGAANTAVGSNAMFNNTSGINNTSVGFQALSGNMTGGSNTAVGHQALQNATTATGNTAIGSAAGSNWTTGGLNIAIGTGVTGDAGDSGIIRIGNGLLQNTTYIAGIASSTLASMDNVCVESDGQLGKCGASSRRFKQDIRDLEGESDGLARLHPVAFRYRPEVSGEEVSPQRYGLIAEEVAEVYPHLVGFDDQGRPERVNYEMLTPLLLAELQRQQAEMVEMKRELEELKRMVSGE